MSEQTKITDLLNPLCLQQMYEGEESGILLILDKKVILDKYIRLRARDARYEDNVICDVKEVLEEIQIGDLRWFTKCVCINTPNWRRSLKPGRGILVGRVEEINTENLVEPPLPMPDHVTHPV